MHQQLAELESGRWREKPAFDEYLEVLEGVMPAGKVSAGGREFVELVPDKFLKTYRTILNKHALDPWTSPELLVLILGGNNILAKHFLRRVFDRTGYTAPDVEIAMSHHQTSASPATVNIPDALEYLIDDHMTHDIDSCPLYNDALIQDHLDDWIAFAAADDKVDLLDSSSWGDCNDFTSLKDLI